MTRRLPLIPVRGDGRFPILASPQTQRVLVRRGGPRPEPVPTSPTPSSRIAAYRSGELELLLQTFGLTRRGVADAIGVDEAVLEAWCADDQGFSRPPDVLGWDRGLAQPDTPPPAWGTPWRHTEHSSDRHGAGAPDEQDDREDREDASAPRSILPSPALTRLALLVQAARWWEGHQGRPLGAWLHAPLASGETLGDLLASGTWSAQALHQALRALAQGRAARHEFPDPSQG